MTMKIPHAPPAGSNENGRTPERPTYDPEKHYRFTWPGQPTRIVAGEELTALTRGANLDLLEIEEVSVSDAPEKVSSFRDTRD